MQIKVCGITERAELDVLADQGVDLVGLWYGVEGGPADLPLERWRELAGAAAEAERPDPVLVTFLKDAERLREALEGSPVRWVQLHGYQTPGLVRAVKAISEDVRVLKVLHVRRGKCVESPLIAGYEKAGVDAFLFDAVADDGRVGSTGQTLDAELVATLAEPLERPFLLAGGISDANRERFAPAEAAEGFMGIDVDTNARGPDGRIDGERVAAISRTWRAGPA